MNSPVKFVKWYVKGLGHVVKQKKILLCLRKEGALVAMFSETHLSETEHLKLKTELGSFKPQLRKRGIAILFSKHLPFILEQQVTDPEGRFIFISDTVFEQHTV